MKKEPFSLEIVCLKQTKSSNQWRAQQFIRGVCNLLGVKKDEDRPYHFYLKWSVDTSIPHTTYSNKMEEEGEIVLKLIATALPNFPFKN